GAVVNLVVAYLPVAFQRKMIMGEHIPLAILSGAALAYIARNRSPIRWRLKLGVLILLLSPSCYRFLARDTANTTADRVQSGQRAYLLSGEVTGLRWIEHSAARGAVVQPLPWIALSPEGKPPFYDT